MLIDASTPTRPSTEVSAGEDAVVDTGETLLDGSASDRHDVATTSAIIQAPRCKMSARTTRS